MIGDPGLETGEESPRRIVRKGWNAVSTIYRPGDSCADSFGHTDVDYRRWLDPILRELAPQTKVLDLGSGCGVPSSQILATKFQVTGVDLSDVQIERAQRLVPGATFIRADMTEVSFSSGTFGAVVSLYAIIHVPLELQHELLVAIHDWISSNGLFLATLGDKAWTGTEANWMGSNARMYWSHTDAETYQRWLTEIGFVVLQRTYVAEGDSGHVLFLSRKGTPRA